MYIGAHFKCLQLFQFSRFETFFCQKTFFLVDMKSILLELYRSEYVNIVSVYLIFFKMMRIVRWTEFYVGLGDDDASPEHFDIDCHCLRTVFF